MNTKMKRIKGYDGSGFYIKRLQDYILIVSNSVSNPLEYTYELGREIDKLSKKISSSKVQVFFDLTPFMKKSTIFSILYDKKRKTLDVNSHKNLNEEEIPLPIKRFLYSFYHPTRNLSKITTTELNK